MDAEDQELPEIFLVSWVPAYKCPASWGVRQSSLNPPPDLGHEKTCPEPPGKDMADEDLAFLPDSSGTRPPGFRHQPKHFLLCDLGHQFGLLLPVSPW